MTYEASEQSWDQGAPVEFYRFVRGTDFWRYNTSDRALPRMEPTEVVYAGSAIRRERIRRGAEAGQMTLSIRVPRSLSVTDLWFPYPSSQPVGLDIFRENLGAAGYGLVWSGRVVAPVYSPEAVELKVEPTATYASKAGQAQTWQRNCGHVFGSQGDGLCNADIEAFAVDAVVSSVMANIVSSADFDAYETPNRLAGGHIRWTDADGVMHRRSISGHNGATITLLYGTNNLPNGTTVRAYPGCRLTWDDCVYYNNSDNFDGELYLPERSPFNGNPVF